MTRRLTYRQILDQLNKYKYAEGYSFTEISRRTGVPRNTVARMFNGDPVSVLVFFKVLEGLKFDCTITEY